MAPSRSPRPIRRSIASGCGRSPGLASACGARASKCPISISPAVASRCGHRSPASAATSRLSSPSSAIATAILAATIGTPTIRSRPMSPRAAMRCMSRRALTPASISAIPPSTKSRRGRFRRGSSFSRRRALPTSSPRCRRVSGARHACPNGLIRAPSSASRTARAASIAWRRSSMQARSSRGSGARIGWACASPASASASSGTGRPMRAAIRRCA